MPDLFADLPRPLRGGKVRLGSLPWPLAPRADGRCPLCLDSPGSDYCGHGDHTANAPTDRAVSRAGLAAMIAEAGRSYLAECHDKARERCAEPLTERDRRNLWNGDNGRVRSESRSLSPLVLAFRAALTEIGQAPDWSIRLTPERSVKLVTNVTRFDTTDPGTL